MFPLPGFGDLHLLVRYTAAHTSLITTASPQLHFWRQTKSEEATELFPFFPKSQEVPTSSLTSVTCKTLALLHTIYSSNQTLGRRIRPQSLSGFADLQLPVITTTIH
ncbi:hypothetical protein Hdeb2414_s0027g00689901 [Helianthus debilis subsp. tardiflorus]